MAKTSVVARETGGEERGSCRAVNFVLSKNLRVVVKLSSKNSKSEFVAESRHFRKICVWHNGNFDHPYLLRLKFAPGRKLLLFVTLTVIIVEETTRVANIPSSLKKYDKTYGVWLVIKRF